MPGAIYAVFPPIVDVGAEFTRPANTTAYAAGDVVSNNASTTTPMQFGDVAGALGGSGTIRRVKIFTNQAAMTAGLTLVLFKSSTFVVQGDNVAYTNEWDDRASYVGTVAVGSLTAGTEYAYGESSPDLEFQCAAGTADLWGFLLSAGTPTPASGQQYRVELSVER